MARQAQGDNILKTLWVFRYYDLNDRNFQTYAQALLRLIEFIRELAVIKRPGQDKPKVNIIAHSMGGRIVRELIQKNKWEPGSSPKRYISKIVTLGTPHKGISFRHRPCHPARLTGASSGR